MSFFPNFCTGHEVTYIRIAWNNKNMTCNWIFHGFYFALLLRSAGKGSQTSPYCFQPIRTFTLSLWADEVVASLNLHELMRVPHADTCSLGFEFLCDQFQQKGELKLMKITYFLVFLAVFVIFAKFSGRFRNGLW